MAENIVDLEMELRGSAGSYTLEMRLNRSLDNEDRSGPFPAPVDTARLRALLDQPQAYAAALTEMLFFVAEAREKFAEARGIVRGLPRGKRAALRLRLMCGPGAEDLHALRWELLNQPGTQERLATREDILFSRYLPVGGDIDLPGAKSELRALAAVAAPIDTQRYDLPPINRACEVKRARGCLTGLVVSWVGEHDGDPCTIERLADATPGQDVLYLVCHGKTTRSDGRLLLENSDGSARLVAVGDLIRRLSGAARLPRLAVLVVCESAGSTTAETLAALAPRLVEAGIPAVIGMSGALTYPTADRFVPPLLRELLTDGVIDRSVSVARRAIINRTDDSAPVLFMGLKSGQLWSGVKVDDGTPAVVRPDREVVKDTPATGVQPGEVDPVELYHLLNSDAFRLEDLEDMCFKMGVDWELIPGQVKPAKARAMIRYFQTRGRLSELSEMARRPR